LQAELFSISPSVFAFFLRCLTFGKYEVISIWPATWDTFRFESLIEAFFLTEESFCTRHCLNSSSRLPIEDVLCREV
jgi:uncharacterized Fe-S cluster-containing radical SAM superfamily protein